MTGILNFLSTAETATAQANEMLDVTGAVQQVVENPGETLSELGKFFMNIGQSILNAIPTILFAILVLILGLLVTKLVLWILAKGMAKTKLDITVTKFIGQIAKIALYVLLITIILPIVGIPSTSIITVIGTAGVAIGLALQGSLSNVAGGFLLMINKPFKVGDYIIVGGVEGVVSQISIMYTRLDSATNQAIYVPNGAASNATVVNNSGNNTRRVDLTFSISYEDDFEKAQSIILDIFKKNKMVLDNPAPSVRMLEHGASAIVIAARPWCKSGDYWDVYFDTIEQVRAEFIKNNISIPYGQLDVHVVEDKTK